MRISVCRWTQSCKSVIYVLVIGFGNSFLHHPLTLPKSPNLRCPHLQFLELADVISSGYFYDADYNIVRKLADSDVSHEQVASVASLLPRGSIARLYDTPYVRIAHGCG